MLEVKNFNWSIGTIAEQLETLRGCSVEELRKIAIACDWRPAQEMVLGWIMAQRCIDLTTALQVFMNAEPEKLNYVSKRNLSNRHLGTARLLDNICLRINCGFYLPLRGTSSASQAQVNEWVSLQTAARHEGREARWELDEKILRDLLKDDMQVALPEKNTRHARPGVLRNLFSVPVG